MPDISPRECVKEARKIDPTDWWIIEYDERYANKSPWNLYNRNHRFNGRTLRSCLNKLRKEMR